MNTKSSIQRIKVLSYFAYTDAAKIIRTISFLIKRSQNEGFFRFRQYKNDHYVMYYLHYKNQCY